jgi:hypothetical protein
MGTGSRYVDDIRPYLSRRPLVETLTPTPTALTSGGVFGIPWLSDGMLGAVLGAGTAWATQLVNRKWGRGDRERDEVLRRLDEFDKHAIEVNKALLRIELQIKEQGDYIEPLKEVMQEILREKLLHGGAKL